MHRAINGKIKQRKLLVAKLTNQQRIEQALGRKIDVHSIILQADYVQHILKYHGKDGFRNDSDPVNADDLTLVHIIINKASQIKDGGVTRHNNRKIEINYPMDGKRYRLIGELREGKKNNNLAVYNLYKI